MGPTWGILRRIQNDRSNTKNEDIVYPSWYPKSHNFSILGPCQNTGIGIETTEVDIAVHDILLIAFNIYIPSSYFMGLDTIRDRFEPLTLQYHVAVPLT